MTKRQQQLNMRTLPMCHFRRILDHKVQRRGDYDEIIVLLPYYKTSCTLLLNDTNLHYHLSWYSGTMHMCTRMEQFVILQTSHVKQRYELLSQLICFHVYDKANQVNKWEVVLLHSWVLYCLCSTPFLKCMLQFSPFSSPQIIFMHHVSFCPSCLSSELLICCKTLSIVNGSHCQSFWHLFVIIPAFEVEEFRLKLRLIQSGQVRFVCSETGRALINSIKEAPTCKYTVVFHAPTLCKHP